MLRALLDADGAIVGKARLFALAWDQSEVGDESLTRCIYSLRRRLRKDRSNKYIETVYGQGYRLLLPPSRSQPGRRLAVLPFSGIGIDLAGLHFRLVERFRAVDGVNVVPSALTRDKMRPEAILELTRYLAPDFFLAGTVFRDGEVVVVNMELIGGKDHALLAAESLTLPWDERGRQMDAPLIECIRRMLEDAGGVVFGAG